MLKKILIGLVIVGVIGVLAMIGIGYGTYKVVDETIKENEPQLRQYIQLDEAAQNQFVLKHANKLLDELAKYDVKPEDAEKAKAFEEAQKDPSVQQALISVGRSFYAMLIMASDAIVKDLSADLKAKYEKEQEAFDANFDAYRNAVDKVTERIKAAQ